MKKKYIKELFYKKRIGSTELFIEINLSMNIIVNQRIVIKL
jgi:hypothetical protein